MKVQFLRNVRHSYLSLFMRTLIILLFVVSHSRAQNMLADKTAYYPRVIRLQNNGSANGRLIASFDYGSGALFYESNDQGLTWSANEVGNVSDNTPPRHCCSGFYEVPINMGATTAGTLFWATSVGTDQGSRGPCSIRIWKSTDQARSWKYFSTAVSGNTGLWEPEFAVDSQGRLVIYFSSEEYKGSGYNQLLAHRVSTDGGATWGDDVIDVGVNDGSKRPGMAVVRKLPNGNYVMTYEVCGYGNCDVFIRTSTNGYEWGTASNLGTRVESTKNNHYAHAPTVAWANDGSANGILLVVGQTLYTNSGSFADGNGKVIMINNNNGIGVWTEIAAPVESPNSGDNPCPNYSSPLLPSTNGQQFLELALKNTSNGCRLYYGTGSIGSTTTPPPPTSSSYAINTGGGATGTFAADAYVSGGNTYSVTSTIDVSGAANPAPAAVYQSERWGPSTYTFPSLTSSKSYTVRLHFAEIFFNAAGKRKFNVDINGTRELTDFDVFAAAGANNKAVVKEYTITPNSSNQIIIAFTNGALDNAKISGIEVFPATSTSTTFSGYYKLTAKHSGKVLDVDQSSTADGATVKQYTSNGTDAQKWLLEDVGGGYYSLKARCSGKALDVNGGPTATGNGVKVQQWTYGGGDNQKWKIDSVGGGYYKLTAKHSGKCLDISGGPSATGDGALANQWDYAGGDNQKWALTYISATGAREASATGKKVENTEPALNNFYVYPNPSNGIANISYTATHNEQIAIHLYDTQGKLVKTIFNGAALKGVEQNYRVDGSSLREGLYIIKLKTSSETITKKVIFDK